MKTLARRDHLVCPLCGRFHPIATGGTVPGVMNEHHELAGKVQELGGKSAIKWSERPLTDAELTVLREVVGAVLTRIEDEMEKRGIG